jgi:hypothetical protein
MRPKGRLVYDSTFAPNPVAEAATQRQEQLREERRLAAEKRAARPVPNRLCYPEAFAGWEPGMKLPRCRRCRAVLHPEENHVCPGYIPDATRLNTDLTPEERGALRRAAPEEAGDWDDDQYDPTTPDPDFGFAAHEAETGETKDQVVIEGMTEEEYLLGKFGTCPDGARGPGPGLERRRYAFRAWPLRHRPRRCHHRLRENDPSRASPENPSSPASGSEGCLEQVGVRPVVVGLDGDGRVDLLGLVDRAHGGAGSPGRKCGRRSP